MKYHDLIAFRNSFKNHNYLFFILVIIPIALAVSCRKDFGSVPSYGKLTFSKDTVFLDTIFTGISSETYDLKIYNRSDKSITIPTIKLERGISSGYRLSVNGLAGKSFKDVYIPANDSIYLFVEATIDFKSALNPLYIDKVLFDDGANRQEVPLVTLVRDATFIFPSKNKVSMKIDANTINEEPTTINGRFLDDKQLTFTSKKPYVIYGYAVVPSGKELIIEAGAQIYFHKNSGLIVDKNASLKINGTLDKKVVFQSDRLEHRFRQTPGQWGTIWLRQSSKDNKVNYAQIKNATIGLLIEGENKKVRPDLEIKNSEIYNSSNYGILVRSSNIKADNLVVGNSGMSCVSCIGGGTYNFSHCTFANFWNNSPRRYPAVLVNNYTIDNQATNPNKKTYDLYVANFTNCIISGSEDVEFVLDRAEGSSFNYDVKNSLIQFDDRTNRFQNNNELNFKNVANYQDVILNANPDFKNPFLNKFIIGKNSAAIGKADKATAKSIPFDILAVSRLANPDIGAYQHVDFEKRQ